MSPSYMYERVQVSLTGLKEWPKNKHDCNVFPVPSLSLGFHINSLVNEANGYN